MSFQQQDSAQSRQFGNIVDINEKQIPHVVLQNGGYGNIIYNIMYLLQIRISKFFEGEDFDDVKFSHLFLKFYDMLKKQEVLINPPIVFSHCLGEIIESVTSLNFTKHGVRIQKAPSVTQKRGKSNDFRIRNGGPPPSAFRPRQ